MGVIKLYVPCSSEKEAKALASYLLEDRLIACATMFPAKSIYWWKGKIEESEEYVLLCTTRKDLRENAVRALEERHSYDTPCILEFRAEANSSYDAWVDEVTKK